MKTKTLYCAAIAAILLSLGAGAPRLKSARVVELQPGEILVIKYGGKYWVFDGQGVVDPGDDPAPKPPAGYRAKIRDSVELVTDPDKRANAAKLAEIFVLVGKHSAADPRIDFATAEKLQSELVAKLFDADFPEQWKPFADVFKAEARRRNDAQTLDKTHPELWATTAAGLRDAAGEGVQGALSDEWRRMLRLLFEALLKILLEKLGNG